MARWIWLPKDKYPEKQFTVYSGLSDKKNGNFTVAEFFRSYDFDKLPSSVTIRFSADTAVVLYVNGKCVATGPASVGGDFLGNGEPRPNYYMSELEYTPTDKHISIFARVKMMPVQMCEYSKGHGGFYMSAEAKIDGNPVTFGTDREWLVRYNGAYNSPYSYDGRIAPDETVNAEELDDLWRATLAPIPVREEREITFSKVTLAPNEEREEALPLDMIYAGFLHILSKGAATVSTAVYLRELDEVGRCERAILKGNDEYRGFVLHSVGNLLVKLKNESTYPAQIILGVITTCYPTEECAVTETSDGEINEIMRVSRHTLKYCRQAHHLDSPKHCEPLACTGDYYIESLMTAFSFGDMRLAEFDILRTAELLRNNGGRMFHTTYSLIWVRMLLDVYMITGNISTVRASLDALSLLLRRFEGYIGENGLIETPPDYMFVDWIYIDGLSMHHPPKALGQTCLNMFYYGALDAAEKIYLAIDDYRLAAETARAKGRLRKAINAHLFDSARGIYFEGLNTETPDEILYNYMPKNVEKRYYLKHSNILAVYFGVCEGSYSKSIIDKIMTDEIAGDYQPYFAHYLLEAIYKVGYRDKYTMKVIDLWRKPVKDCPYGLAEGFVKPEPTYSFDHSHAWGGTPLYSLPKALLGLEIVEAGYKAISVCPSTLGLKSATVELPTPYGVLRCALQEGCEPIIDCPKEIKLTVY